MKKNNNIPAGYQLHVTSWENDADNYKTEIVSGLTSEDVKYLLALLKNFGRKGKHGNENVGADVLLSIFTKTMEKHPDTSDECEKFCPLDEREVHSVIEELLSAPSEGYDGDFVRYFESFEVYFVPHEIIDVSDQFK
jgi:hypothetical protein